MSATSNHDVLAEQARQVAKEIAVILSGTTTHGDGSSWAEKAERLIAREWLRAYRGGVQASATFLDEHAKGYEDAATSVGLGGYIAQAHLLREKAGGLRQLVKGMP